MAITSVLLNKFQNLPLKALCLFSKIIFHSIDIIFIIPIHFILWSSLDILFSEWFEFTLFVLYLGPDSFSPHFFYSLTFSTPDQHFKE